MLANRCIITLFCGIAVFLSSVRAEDKNAWRENLDTAIPEGIRLLEAKEYLLFLQAFMNPEQAQKIMKSASLEDFAKKFGEKKASNLLDTFKKIKGRTPTLQKEGRLASFDVDVEGSTNKLTIKFVKVEKYWYLMN